ncbi:MAG: hypothetical protein HY587_03925 [Candidatus Omnitrophica bacterium]|nr:hypothetical protein [Candidatus Omnitrophota bacterium]
MKRAKQFAAILLVLQLFVSFAPSAVWAENTAVHGDMTGKTFVHGLASLLIWPGVGQYLNDNKLEKNWTHAALGLTGIFRLWSGWDAMIDRKGGRWDGKI